MRSIQFICDGCGSVFQIRKLISYFTCKICGSYLLVEKRGKNIYTEVVEELPFKPAQQNELNQLLQDKRTLPRMTDNISEPARKSDDVKLLSTLLLFIIFGLLVIQSLMTHELLYVITGTFVGGYTFWYVNYISNEKE